MLEIVCYGGVGEIGGNKVLLRDSGSSIMLDFGKSFGAMSHYFDEFLQPRPNSVVRDLLTLSMLPPIPGIYRQDMLKHSRMWEALQDGGIPSTARTLFEHELESYDDYLRHNPPALDGILISHGHTDHCQHLCFVDPRIPVYCSAPSLAIMRAAQEIGQSGCESDVWESRQRSASTCGPSSTFPGEMKIDTATVPRNIRKLPPYSETAIGGFKVKAIPVDHSVPGSYAFHIVSPSGTSIFYTGDVRFHGRFSFGDGSISSRLKEFTRGLSPDVLITEGTRVDENNRDSEEDVEKAITEVIRDCSGLAIVDFGWKDTTRYQTLRNVAKATGRVLAVSPKLAYLWALLSSTNPSEFPDLAQEDSVRVYVKRMESMAYSLADYTGSKHVVGRCLDWGDKSRDMKSAFSNKDHAYLEERLCHYHSGVRAYDIAANPKGFILHAGYFDMNELFDILPPPGSVFIRAACEPFSDEMALDEKKLGNWLKHFRINDGEGVVHCHVSGHAGQGDLLDFIADMKPQRIIPIHTVHPEVFQENFDVASQVILPISAVPIQV